ncbi:MAG: NfeD family protein [Rubripirellula sp.]
MTLVYAIGLLLAFYLLLVAEFFLPTGGLVGGAAVAALIAALFLAFSHSMLAGVVMSVVVLVTTPLVFYGLLVAWPHTPIGRRMLNRRPGERAERKQRKTADGTPLEQLVGRIGQARTDLLPSGQVLISGNKLDAVSTGMPIDAGSDVIVTSVEARRIHVRLVTEEDRVENPPEADQTPQSPPSLEGPLEAFDFE